MSQEKVEVVRQTMSVAPRPHRRLEERLALRLPGAAVLLTRLVQRLPLRSRLRRAVIGRASLLGFEAVNRGDFESAFVLYHPRVEFVAEALTGLGFDGVYRGREVRADWQRRWLAEWGDFQFLPEELIYLGRDRLFFTGHAEGRGQSSGATFDTYWAVVLTLSAGRVVREHFFFDRAKALEAAGLSE